MIIKERSRLLSGLIDWVVNLMTILGAPGAGIAVFLENLFPPIPSEVILPLAGFTVARGGFSFISAVIWSTAGSVLGALALYWVGHAFGEKRLKEIADWMWLVEPEDVDKAIAFFSRHGKKSIFFGRFVPGVRSLISIPAGLSAMPKSVFLMWTTLGSLIWNVTLIALGYWLGAQYHLVADVIDQYSTVIYVIIAALLAFGVAMLIRRNVRRRNASS